MGVALAPLVLLAACSGNQGSVQAPTVAVGATPSGSPQVPGGSPSLASPVQIADVEVGPNDAFILLQNVGAGGSSRTASVSLAGWKLEVGSTTVTLPTSLSIAPGSSLAIHTGPAASSASPAPSPAASPVSVPSPGPRQDLELEQGQALRDALQPGARVFLVDDRNTIVSQGVVPQNVVPGASPSPRAP